VLPLLEGGGDGAQEQRGREGGRGRKEGEQELAIGAGGRGQYRPCKCAPVLTMTSKKSFTSFTKPPSPLLCRKPLLGCRVEVTQGCLVCRPPARCHLDVVSPCRTPLPSFKSIQAPSCAFDTQHAKVHTDAYDTGRRGRRDHTLLTRHGTQHGR